MLTSPQTIEGELSVGISDPYEPHFAMLSDTFGALEDVVTWIENLYWDGQRVRITVEILED
jgi:hypothetical protein